LLLQLSAIRVPLLLASNYVLPVVYDEPWSAAPLLCWN